MRDDVIGVTHLRLLKQLTRLIIARENLKSNTTWACFLFRWV